MTDIDRSKLFGINIINAENVPEERNLAIKIFSVGAIRTIIYQTKTTNGPNPEWNSNVLFMHPIRGFRIHFEMINLSKQVEKVVAIGDFDLRTNSIDLARRNLQQAQQSNVSVKLNVLQSSSRYPDPPKLNLRIHYMPMMNFMALSKISLCSNPSISTPFYFTVDPCKAITVDDVRGNINYRFPYELSVILLNENQKSFTIVNSSNRHFPGCSHSGSNLCGSFNSLTQTIRFDPNLLYQSSIKYILITINSINFAPLKTVLSNDNSNPIHCFLTAWSSSEPSGELTSNSTNPNSSNRNTLPLTSITQQTLKTVGQFPIHCQDDSSFVLASVGKIVGTQLPTKGKSKNQKPQYQATVSFAAFDTQLPSSKNPIATQDPTNVVTLLLKNTEYSQDRASLSVDYSAPTNISRSPSRFPLLVPRSLTEALNGDCPSNIFALCPLLTSLLSDHLLTAFAFDINLNSLFTCSKREPTPVQQYLKRQVNQQPQEHQKNANSSVVYNGSGIEVHLNDLPLEVSTILFAIMGSKPLSSDHSNSSVNMTAYSDNDVMLLNTHYNSSRHRNSMIWFAIYRDPFDSWGLLNINRAESILDVSQLRNKFEDIMKQVLKF